MRGKTASVGRKGINLERRKKTCRRTLAAQLPRTGCVGAPPPGFIRRGQYGACNNDTEAQTLTASRGAHHGDHRADVYGHSIAVDSP